MCARSRGRLLTRVLSHRGHTFMWGRYCRKWETACVSMDVCLSVCSCSGFCTVCFRLQPDSSPSSDPDRLPCHQAPLYGSFSGSSESVSSTHSSVQFKLFTADLLEKVQHQTESKALCMCLYIRLYFFSLCVCLCVVKNLLMSRHWLALGNVYRYSFPGE